MSRRRRSAGDASDVVGYLRVSTEEQARSGLGLAAQETTIRSTAAARQLRVVAVFGDEGVSGKAIDNRPGLESVLACIHAGNAGTLMVAKLDRLSRRMEDLVTLVGSSAREGWALTSCDGVLDTSTPEGRLMGHVMGSFAEFERELARSRTVAALAVKKAQGVRLGAPVRIASEIRARIAQERAAGRTYRAIGDALVADGIPNSRGEVVWFPAAVRSVAVSVGLDEAARAARST